MEGVKLTIFLMILLVPAWTRGQGICVADTAKVNAVRGVIKINVKGRDEALPGVRIVITRQHRRSKIVGNTVTDELGHFEVAGLASGTFTLVTSYPGLRDFSIDLILKREKGKVKSDRLEIWLGADFEKPCSGSFFKVT
jgi:hypothetical protein